MNVRPEKYHDEFKIISNGTELSYPVLRIIGALFLSGLFGLVLGRIL
jgi:hypothetical protein